MEFLMKTSTTQKGNSCFRELSKLKNVLTLRTWKVLRVLNRDQTSSYSRTVSINAKYLLSSFAMIFKDNLYKSKAFLTPSIFLKRIGTGESWKLLATTHRPQKRVQKSNDGYRWEGPSQVAGLARQGTHARFLGRVSLFFSASVLEFLCFLVKYVS